MYTVLYCPDRLTGCEEVNVYTPPLKVALVVCVPSGKPSKVKHFVPAPKKNVPEAEGRVKVYLLVMLLYVIEMD